MNVLHQAALSYADRLAGSFRGTYAARNAELTVDKHAVITIRQVGAETVQVVPMIYNDRIVIGTDPEHQYEHGWCYDKGGLAVLCALIWDPAIEDEPIGYKKKATPGHRRAPEKGTP